jgi:hypothetical protein
MSKDRHDCDEQKPRAKQEQTESGAANLSDCRALIYRLLAGRFALDSPHHLLLRMLARSAMRRMRRLEALHRELSGTATSGLPRRWLPGNIGVRGRLLESGHFHSSGIRKSENEIEETRKNLSYVSANRGMHFIGRRSAVSKLRSAVSVEQGWKDVFPSRAAFQLGGFCRASGDTKSR